MRWWASEWRKEDEDDGEEEGNEERYWRMWGNKNERNILDCFSQSTLFEQTVLRETSYNYIICEILNISNNKNNNKKFAPGNWEKRYWERKTRKRGRKRKRSEFLHLYRVYSLSLVLRRELWDHVWLCCLSFVISFIFFGILLFSIVCLLYCFIEFICLNMCDIVNGNYLLSNKYHRIGDVEEETKTMCVVFFTIWEIHYESRWYELLVLKFVNCN